MVFLGILGFMDEQRLGWEPPHHGTNSLASNTPAAPRVYRIKFKLLRLEFKTCSTWLQCLILRNMSSLSGPFPFIHAVHWCEKPFPFPSSSLSFLGLAQMPSSHNHSPGCTASSEVWEEEEGMCRPQRPAKIQVTRTSYLILLSQWAGGRDGFVILNFLFTDVETESQNVQNSSNVTQH